MTRNVFSYQVRSKSFLNPSINTDNFSEADSFWIDTAGANLMVLMDGTWDLTVHRLTTPHDMSTCMWDPGNSVNLDQFGLFNPYRVVVNPYGNTVYVQDNSSGGSNPYGIYQFDLSESWNLQTISLRTDYGPSLNWTASGALAQMQFKPDGTELYCWGLRGSPSPSRSVLVQYTLSEAWNCNTATLTSYTVTGPREYANSQYEMHGAGTTGCFFDITSDGTKMVVHNPEKRSFMAFELGTAWDLSTIRLTRNQVQYCYTDKFIMGTTTGGGGINIREDGKTLYCLSGSGLHKAEFLGDPNDINDLYLEPILPYTAKMDLYNRYYTNGFTPYTYRSYPANNKYYVLTGLNNTYEPRTIIEYDITSANLGQISLKNVYSNWATFSLDCHWVTDFHFSNNGTRLFLNDSNYSDIIQVDLDEAWNISSGNVDTKSWSCDQDLTNFRGFHFGANGTYVYVAESSPNQIIQYTLTEAWNIQTVNTASNTVYTPTEPAGAVGMVEMAPHGNTLYVIDISFATIYQYALSETWNCNTATYTTRKDRSSWAGANWYDDGMVVYFGTNSQNEAYALTEAWNVNTIGSIISANSWVPSSTLNQTGIAYGANGNYVYTSVSSFTVDDMARYKLKTPYDMRSLELGAGHDYYAKIDQLGEIYNSTGISNPALIGWSPDGNSVFFGTSSFGTGGAIVELSTSIPWDITNLTNTGIWIDTEVYT